MHLLKLPGTLSMMGMLKLLILLQRVILKYTYLRRLKRGVQAPYFTLPTIKPHQIAAGAIFMAAKFLKIKLPSGGEKVWWQGFDVTPRHLEGWSRNGNSVGHTCTALRWYSFFMGAYIMHHL